MFRNCQTKKLQYRLRSGTVALICMLLVLPAVLVAGCAPTATEEAFPSQPVQVIIPYAAAGGTDRTVRVHGGSWGIYADVPLRVVNMPGAGAVEGMRFVAEAEPDGYTLVACGSDIAIIPLIRDVGFTIDDFSPLCITADYGFWVCVPPDSPFDTWDEFAAHVEGHPGELTMASYGAGSSSDFGIALLLDRSGLEMKVVPLDGGAEQVAQLMGGHVDAALVTTGSGLPAIVAGDIKALATTDRERHSELPDVPMVTEVGVDAEWLNGRMYLAPAGTPQDRLDTLAGIFQNIVEDPGTQKLVKTLGEREHFVGPEEFTTWIREQRDALEPLAEAMME